jgi:hypothetical protein
LDQFVFFGFHNNISDKNFAQNLGDLLVRKFDMTIGTLGFGISFLARRAHDKLAMQTFQFLHSAILFNRVATNGAIKSGGRHGS